MHVSKITILILAGLLLYLSISSKYGYFLPDNDLLAGKTKGTPVLWIVESPNLFNITQPFKNQLKSLKNISIYSFSQYLNDLRDAWSFAQISYVTNVSGYLSFSESLCLQPGIRTLIFPFHFFL
jgi:hypothetical protein